MLPKGRLKYARRNPRALYRRLHRQRHDMGDPFTGMGVEENSQRAKEEGEEGEGAASSSLT